ncbi:hypothetical protein D3C71_1298040 [compost metagenome]
MRLFPERSQLFSGSDHQRLAAVEPGIAVPWARDSGYRAKPRRNRLDAMGRGRGRKCTYWARDFVERDCHLRRDGARCAAGRSVLRVGRSARSGDNHYGSGADGDFTRVAATEGQSQQRQAAAVSRGTGARLALRHGAGVGVRWFWRNRHLYHPVL